MFQKILSMLKPRSHKTPTRLIEIQAAEGSEALSSAERQALSDARMRESASLYALSEARNRRLF